MISPRMSLRRGALVLISAWLVSACVTHAPRKPLPPAQRQLALARQQVRETVLAAQPQWSLEGRVALSNGQRGGSGRIEWQQHGPAYQVALSAPITRQSWRISGDAEGARLEGFDGGPRVGDDPQSLLREATGWDIPVVNLIWWLRGARAPSTAAGDAVAGNAVAGDAPTSDTATGDAATRDAVAGNAVAVPIAITTAASAQLEFDDSGRLSRLQQDGWVLDYADWRPDPALGIDMPHRINAARAQARVRLVVDAWGSGAGTGQAANGAAVVAPAIAAAPATAATGHVAAGS